MRSLQPFALAGRNCDKNIMVFFGNELIACLIFLLIPFSLNNTTGIICCELGFDFQGLG